MKYEKVLRKATLVFPRRDGEVLLARKTRNIGKGCWNGYGGGVKKGETEEECAVRELAKECGVIAFPEDLKKIAVLIVYNIKSDGTTSTCDIPVYELWRWEGEIQETTEMATPTWFKVDALPLKEMMLADIIWVPAMLKGEKFVATACYGPFQKELHGDVRLVGVNSF